MTREDLSVMTDQPKPNQPTQPPPPAQSAPKDVAPAADKAPTVPAASAEPKPAEVKPEAAKPATDAKPESKPEAASANSGPSKPTGTDGSAPPAKPATADSSAAQPTKPATTESAPQAAQAPKPAESASPAAQPTSSESAKPQEAAPAKAADTASDKPVPVTAPPAAPAPASSSAPTEKRDISEDPTLPGKPASMVGTTRQFTPPSAASNSPTNSKDDTIPPQSTSTKVTQRFTEPSPAGQTAAGTICPSCGHRNRPGTLICDNCGTNLIGGAKSSVGTRDLVTAKEDAPANAPLMDAAQLNAVESAGGSVFSDDMVLRIEIEGGATPMLVYPKQEIILGRRDPNTGTLPDVDMTAYSGYRMGVSRTHASIHLQDKQLNLSDRGSSNGTFLNGTRLVAHRPYQVKDGDEIRLGQMVLKVYFQSNKGRK